MRLESKFPTNNSKGYGYVGIEFIRPGTIQSRRVSASDPPAIVHISFSLPLSARRADCQSAAGRQPVDNLPHKVLRSSGPMLECYSQAHGVDLGRSSSSPLAVAPIGNCGGFWYSARELSG